MKRGVILVPLIALARHANVVTQHQVPARA
jgi:hypothetical protein